jgi:4-oxalmesaconate hydratase
MQFLLADLFKDLPTLRFVIPHGGGAVPYHWGRYRGLSIEARQRPLEALLNNVFFDTCVYHEPGVRFLTQVIPVDNILFGSEMIGAVKGRDPNTGEYFDDTKRYLDACGHLSSAERYKIFEGNARRVYPRLDTLLKGRAATIPS